MWSTDHRTRALRRTFVFVYLFSRAGPEARPGGGLIHGHQVYQRGVSERPRAGGQRLSRRSHGPQSPAALPLLTTRTLLKVNDLSSSVYLTHTPYVHFLKLWHHCGVYCLNARQKQSIGSLEIWLLVDQSIVSIFCFFADHMRWTDRGKKKEIRLDRKQKRLII